jgi:hypothetical protein
MKHCNPKAACRENFLYIVEKADDGLAYFLAVPAGVKPVS